MARFRRGRVSTLVLSSTAAILLASAAYGQTLADILAATRGAPSQSAPQQISADGLFGTIEFTNASLGALPQWSRIVERMEAEAPAYAACARDVDACTEPALRAWHELQSRAAGLPREAQLDAVNRFFNRWPYKSDAEVYAAREYWAAPSEFMARSGDCEDYAIAKYFALRRLGFRAEELRIVVLYDQIRAVGHAVLAVYEPSNDVLILDSLSNFITSHMRYRHYIPQYSMNETTRWAHVDHSRAIPQTALRAGNP